MKRSRFSERIMDGVAEQREKIQDCHPPDLFRRSKTLFLVDAAWWKAWAKYVGYDGGEPDGVRPGPIDNSTLLVGEWRQGDWSNARLKDNITEHSDFEYLAQTAWLRFMSWYGGHPAIEVFLVDGVPDLHPVCITVWQIETNNDYASPREHVLVSTRITVQQLHRYLCQKLTLPYHKYSLHVEDDPCPPAESKLEDLAVGSGSRVYVVMIGVIGRPQRVYPQLTIPERTTPSSHGDTQDESDTEVDVMLLGSQLHADREEVQAKVAAARKAPRVQLSIRDISQTEKAISSLWLDFQHKDVI